MPRRIVVAAALVATGSTQVLAQIQPTEASRWSVQPSVGVLLDAYDNGNDGNRAGPLVGLQVAWRFTPSMLGAASLAYARVNDVASHAPTNAAHPTHRNEWVFATLGPAVELPIRRAMLSLSLQAGAAWRRIALSGLVGEPVVPDPPANDVHPDWSVVHDDDFSVTSVLIPGAAVRVPLGSRLAAVGGASAYWISFDEGGEVSPAFTLGLSWAP